MASRDLARRPSGASAADERFAMVIASCSGEGGAAIARRSYGETLAHMSAPSPLSVPVRRQLREVCGPESMNGRSMRTADLYDRSAPPAPSNRRYRQVVRPVRRSWLPSQPNRFIKLLGKKGLETNQVSRRPDEPILHDLGYLYA